MVLKHPRSSTPHPRTGQLQLPTPPAPESRQARDESARPLDDRDEQTDGETDAHWTEALQALTEALQAETASVDRPRERPPSVDGRPLFDDRVSLLVTPEYGQQQDKYPEESDEEMPYDSGMSPGWGRQPEESDGSSTVMDDEESECAQSLSVTTRSHLCPMDTHFEHLPDSKLARQTKFDFLQREQGMDMTTPCATRDESLSRRTAGEMGLGGMVSKKRRRDITNAAGHEHYLTSHPEKRGRYDDGYRDESLQEEDQVLRNTLPERGSAGSDTFVSGSDVLDEERSVA